jgi:hypothetical protein
LDLLISDAQRRAGQNAEAAFAWTGAARSAARLRDPILWERLVELRPADAVWPGEVQTDIQHQVTTQPEQAATEAAGAGGFDQGFVWRQIAEWRLERNETTAALLAFSRAETESQSAWLKGEARIGQARTLLAMNQDAPAMAILNAQAQSPEPSVSCHALAVLGVATFQKGRTDDGIALLVRAVVNPDGIRWSGYSQAQADLALAYLTVGEEDQGLRLLHEAQDAFAREGRIADLSQCLVNEVAYLKKPGAKSPDRARAILRRIEQLDASPG